MILERRREQCGRDPSLELEEKGTWISGCNNPVADLPDHQLEDPKSWMQDLRGNNLKKGHESYTGQMSGK